MYYSYYTIGGELYHHGIQGQKWGKRNGPPYPLNKDISTGKRLKNTVFISGSSKTQTKDSPYYRQRLPKQITNKIDKMIENNDTIIVGDAPGIDRQVQNYLNKKGYKNVEIYGPGKSVRYLANKSWKTNPIDDPDHEVGSKEWLAKKDIEMSKRANKGMAIILDEGASATRKNINRMLDDMKDVDIYQLNQDRNDDWVLKENYRR